MRWRRRFPRVRSRARRKCARCRSFASSNAARYVGGARDLDFAIAIRTAVLTNGRFEVSAGAGIVADSVPELEAKETRNKARAALAAIAAAVRVRRG
jgi:anthranilate/para-aminobenzoate synthase component I